LQVPELAFPDALSGFLQKFLPSKNRFFTTTLCGLVRAQFFFEFGTAPPLAAQKDALFVTDRQGWILITSVALDWLLFFLGGRQRQMPNPRDCSSSGVGGPSAGDAKDLPQLFLRVGAAVTLSVAGLLFSRRQRPPRQLLLPPPPPPPSGTSNEQMCKFLSTWRIDCQSRYVLC